MQWFKHMVTGRDNTTVDAGRVSWVVSTAAVLAAAVGNWIHNGIVDIAVLWQALAGIAVGHGAAIGVKGKTEPDPDEAAK